MRRELRGHDELRDTEQVAIAVLGVIGARMDSGQIDHVVVDALPKQVREVWCSAPVKASGTLEAAMIFSGRSDAGQRTGRPAALRVRRCRIQRAEWLTVLCVSGPWNCVSRRRVTRVAGKEARAATRAVCYLCPDHRLSSHLSLVCRSEAAMDKTPGHCGARRPPPVDLRLSRRY